MDESDKDNLVQVKNSEENSSYIQIGMSGHWRFNDANLGNSSMMACGDGVGPSYSSGTMAESFGQAMWEQSVDAAASLGYNDMNVHRGGTGGSDPLSLVKAGMFVPNMSGMLSQFPGDSNFIERAARFSSFSGGHIGELFNPFGFQHPPVNPYRQPQDSDANIEETPRDVSLPPEQGAVDGSPQKKEIMMGGSHREAKLGVSVSGNDSDEVELSCGGGTREDATPSLGLKKRKRVRQESESEHTNGTQQQSIEPGMKNPEIKSKGGGQNSSPTGNKSTGKQNSQNSDPPKDDYIHVRARRGQATNSHSLAERVRREKISERMKFLQDLVPGCNKVTGKAVMLDEIINYVQSLQRQVEFLSMKLATVNPRLDFNIEQLFAKDQQKLSALSGIGISPSMPMAYPPIHISQPPMLQSSLPGIGNCSDLLRRTIHSHLTNMGGYKEPTHQLPNAWEDEFDNVVQMGFIANAPLDNQEKNCPVDQRPTEADP